MLQSCYNQIPLTGGPKDETPPVIDTSQSTPNNQVRFEKQKISFVFDEFIALRDPVKQIIVTPPLTYTPQAEERLQTLNFEFDEKEVLKENATYVINFGESIVDFTEGNKLENFTLVFSTGDYIDSLSVSGNIIDAKTQEPSEEYLVMLYESVYDSVVYQEKPFYFARTDESGNFIIKNLRADTFKLFVLNDQNLNYTYDRGEQIGFIDSLIYLTDSSSFDLSLESFLELSEPRYIGYESLARGQMKLEFDQKVVLDSIEVINSDSMNYALSYQTDNFVNLWYEPANLTKINIKFGGDTLSTRINLRSVEPLSDIIEITVSNPSDDIGLHPKDDIVLSLTSPSDSINPRLIGLIDTLSKEIIESEIRTKEDDALSITISPSVSARQELKLTLLPGAITDIWGHTHDTIEQYITIADLEDFGSIQMDCINSNLVEGSYHISLVDESGELIHEFQVLSDTILSQGQLAPGSYSLRIIEDLNSNGQWDPGNYLKKQQSEKYFELPLEKVKGNWIIEKQIDLSNLDLIDESTEGTESQ